MQVLDQGVHPWFMAVDCYSSTRLLLGAQYLHEADTRYVILYSEVLRSYSLASYCTPNNISSSR
jgi:hypothetical protein